MEYTLLTSDLFTQLRAQRILDLEADHFRVELRRREALDPNEVQGLLDQQIEIERRISVHQDPTPLTELTSHHAAPTEHPTPEG